MTAGRVLWVAGLVVVLVLVAPAMAVAAVDGVVGGGSFNDSEPLEGGTFTDRIELDQTLHYQLPRGTGQTLTLSVEVRGTARDPLPAGATLELELFDAARIPAGPPVVITSPLDGKRAEVRAGDAEVGAGDLFAAVGLIGDDLELSEGGPYDLALTVTLDPPLALQQSPAPAPPLRRPPPQPAAPRARPAAQLLPPPTPPQRPVVIAGVAFVVGFGLTALHLARVRPPTQGPTISPRPTPPRIRTRA